MTFCKNNKLEQKRKYYQLRTNFFFYFFNPAKRKRVQSSFPLNKNSIHRNHYVFVSIINILEDLLRRVMIEFSIVFTIFKNMKLSK